jgi:hypothetical protein
MFLKSKRWLLVSAVGQGVMFSLALRGALRFACLLLGTTLSERVAGNLFLVSSLSTGALCGYLYVRSLNRAQSKAAVETQPGERE